MPIAPWAWCAWRVASLAAWSARSLAAAISNARRALLGGAHRGGERHRDDHRLLRAVDEVRLHRLERADRLAELAPRRGVLERDLLEAFERARHRRGAGERAASTERVGVDAGRGGRARAAV